MSKIALVAEHHPASAKNFGTPSLIKTWCASPIHPFQAVVATDFAGRNAVAGPWDTLPIVSLFRPRSLLPKVGLGLLDNFFFAIQSGRVARFLQHHQIDRLFILLANNPRFALFAATNLPDHLPKDIYLVDDFVEDSYIYRMKKSKARWAMEKLLNKSDRVFVISPVAVEDLHHEYGCQSEFLPLPISSSKLSLINTTPGVKSSDDKTLLIHHAGTVHHLYADAMADFVLLLRKLATKRHIKIIIEFWGGISLAGLEQLLKMKLDQQDELLEIRVCASVSPERLIIEQQRADFLLLVNSFTSTLKKQIRYSFSSKTTEYLISGTPILLYAPSYSSLVAHLGQHQAAHIVWAAEAEVALQQLEQIIDDSDRYRTVAAAQKLVRDYHTEKHFFNTISQRSEPSLL